jgi:hypothetical protein
MTCRFDQCLDLDLAFRYVLGTGGGLVATGMIDERLDRVSVAIIPRRTTLNLRISRRKIADGQTRAQNVRQDHQWPTAAEPVAVFWLPSVSSRSGREL